MSVENASPRGDLHQEGVCGTCPAQPPRSNGLTLRPETHHEVFKLLFPDINESSAGSAAMTVRQGEGCSALKGGTGWCGLCPALCSSPECGCACWLPVPHTQKGEHQHQHTQAAKSHHSGKWQAGAEWQNAALALE